MKNIRGFTLIELMLVVIIIGVLAAMVMPRLVGRSEQARIAAARADVNANIPTVLDLFELDTGRYPASLDELKTNPGLGDRWKGPYLKKQPKDPWGRPYIYEPSGADGRDYSLCSEGPDANNPDDNICNQ
ncbi:MAG: type II secretion system major pseudopilin GspG [Candidatus Omnitrophica bacterium]|nr:type II secretion system major pseudopilin GspG [Candidatus Omnitrophota bacterium]